MAIHHAQLRQAEQYGFTLEEKPPHVRAFHPSTAVQIFGVSGKDAIAQMLAFLNINNKDPDIRFKQVPSEPLTRGQLRKGSMIAPAIGTPIELFRSLDALAWEDPSDDDGPYEMHSPSVGEPGYRAPVDKIEDTFAEDSEPKPTVDATPPTKRSESGVPLDGAIAYAEGIMAADNPFPEGTEEADDWDAQWDQAADEAPEPGEGKGGTVVASKYRQRYAAAGHPNHCGDELADLLNSFCVGDKHTDLAKFEEICGLNGVDTSKYKRDGNGWQGRIRMTGRNLLAKVVFANGGKVNLPDGATQQLSQEWLSTRPYKAKDNG